MKLELVIEGNGIPIAGITASADTAEVELAEPALALIPTELDLPDAVPVLADKAYDRDPLRDGRRSRRHASCS